MTYRDDAIKVLNLIDFTSLNDDDTNETILNLCEKATTEFGNVPAICIYPQFIPVAKSYFANKDLAIKIATVTNFPSGNDNLAIALAETKDAINLGADEVDIVFPYTALINGNYKIAQDMISQAKKVCNDKVLKVILESGELKTPELISLASQIAIESGADFIKTSTGKVAINATLEASKIMLKAIKKLNPSCGFKAAGGIRKLSEALEYTTLTEQIMGRDWIKPQHFRFGASSLLNDVLNSLNGIQSTVDINKY